MTCQRLVMICTFYVSHNLRTVIGTTDVTMSSSVVLADDIDAPRESVTRHIDVPTSNTNVFPTGNNIYLNYMLKIIFIMLQIGDQGHF